MDMKLASDDETVTMQEMDNDGDDGYDDQHRDHPHNLSRLSISTSSSTVCEGSSQYQDYEEDDDHHGDLKSAAAMGMFLSRLSIESSDVGIEADAEASEDEKGVEGELVLGPSPSDSDKELSSPVGSYSLPATPPPPRTTRLEEYYASESDATRKGDGRAKRRRRRITRESWLGGHWGSSGSRTEKNGVGIDNEEAVDKITASSNTGYRYCNSSCGGGESEGGGSGGGGGLVVIAKPKGGSRQLCMDWGEVKACRDLGFELEHQQMMLEMPSPPPPISISACGSPHAHLDASSPDCSPPIASWCISSPGQ